MLKTFFGCCPLRHGVSVIAFLNIILNVAEIVKHSSRRVSHYNWKMFKSTTSENTTTTVSTDTVEDSNASSNYDYHMFENIEEVPILNGIFMDCIFIVTISWIVLELTSNICLKQSTFKHNLHKTYVWLVVHYGNLLFMVCHLAYELFFYMFDTNDIESQLIFAVYFHTFEIVYVKLAYVVLIGLQIFVVHSYYNEEKKAMLSNFIQLKWKFVSQGKAVSKGVGYPSAATFKAETSRQTQDGSRVPPFITNILSN